MPTLPRREDKIPPPDQIKNLLPKIESVLSHAAGKLPLPKTPSASFPGAPEGRDRIPAWLEEDEFVVPADKAKKNAVLLQSITFGGAPVPMAGGGPVPHMARGGFLGSRTFGQLGKRLKVAGRNIFKGGRRGRSARRYAARAGSRVLDSTKGGPLSVFGEGADAFKDLASGNEIGAATKGFKMLATRVQGAMNPNDKLQAAGDAAGAAGLGLSIGAGPFAPIVAGVGIFAEVTLKAADKLKEFSNQLHESNMKFAEISGSMAGVMARQEARDIYLNLGKGEARAGSAEFLASGKNELERATAPIENAMAKGQNILTGILDRMMADFLKVTGLTALGEVLGKLLDLLVPSAEGQGGMETLDAMAKRFEGDYGRPKHLPGG